VKRCEHHCGAMFPSGLARKNFIALACNKDSCLLRRVLLRDGVLLGGGNPSLKIGFRSTQVQSGRQQGADRLDVLRCPRALRAQAEPIVFT
jgi:hypothetical protein